MSVLFTDSAGVYLSGTLGTGLNPASWRVASCFIKATSWGFDEYLSLLDGSGSYGMGIDANTSAQITSWQAASYPTKQGRSGSDIAALSSGTWYHFAAWYEPVDTSSLIRPFVDGSAARTAGGNLNMTGAGSFVDLVLGASSDVRMAETALFEAANQTDAEALIAELATTYANAVSTSATLRGYWPLVNDANFDTAGVNLTNTGSAAFDAGADHPSLSGGGGGGMTRPLILPFGHFA